MDKTKVIPNLLSRRPLPATYRDILERVVFGYGPRYGPCYPCFGLACSESWCEYHPKGEEKRG